MLSVSFFSFLCVPFEENLENGTSNNRFGALSTDIFIKHINYSLQLLSAWFSLEKGKSYISWSMLQKKVEVTFQHFDTGFGFYLFSTFNPTEEG